MLDGDYDPNNIAVDIRLGYEYIYDPGHPLANRAGKVYWHRVVASRKIGRWIESKEHVHHINENRGDNRPENIEILSSSRHSQIHHPRTKVLVEHPCNKCGKPTLNKKFCGYICCRMAERRVDRPNIETLAADIDNMSWRAIGRKYGVSDNAARKWARSFGLI